MDKMIVCVFDSEEQTYQGLKGLNELSDEGSIHLYASAVISKDEEGRASVKQSADEGPIGVAVGALTGALIGVIGGPVGMAVGATTGGLLGSVVDINTAGVGVTFASDVAEQLTDGKSAVVAEIAEEWVTPLDSRVEKLGGTVIRQNRVMVVDEQMSREIEEADAELEQLEKELEQSAENTKSKINAKIADAKSKLAATKAKVDAKAKSLEAEAVAKYDSLKEHAATAKADRKVRYESWATEVKENYARRSARIKEACKA